MTSHNDDKYDMEGIAAFLKEAVENVKTEENPDLLNEFKKVYKKNVPFSLRMYVAAYLTKQAQRYYKKNPRNRLENNNQKQYTPRTKKSFRSNSSTPSSSVNNSIPTPKSSHIKIAETLATTIFIGIGRNRRVYPRDLVGLIASVAEIDRERIGEIRVLANYSFVQLFSEDADKVIKALDGYDYRGRKISVSFSRKKDDISETNTSSLRKQTESETSAESEKNALSKEDAKAYAAAEKAAASREPFGTSLDNE